MRPANGSTRADIRSSRAICASNVALNTWDSFGNDLTTYQATGVHIDDFATLSMRTYSYTGLDQADVTWQGRFDGRLNVNLAGGWMSDTLSANLNVNENSDGDLFASVIGWWQPDLLTLNIFEEDFSLNSLAAYVDGGWFTADTLNATGNVSTFNT